MNPTNKPLQPNQTSTLRLLPYFIAAAIIINTNLGVIPIDAVLMLTASLANVLGSEIDLNPNLGYYILGIVRVYGNIILVVALMLLTLRQHQEKK